MYTTWQEKQDWYLKVIQSGVKGNTAIVAYVISTFVNGTDDSSKRGLAWPDREQILERMGRPATKSNLNMLSAWINELGELGWLDVQVKGLPAGKKNIYRLEDGTRSPRKLTPKPKKTYPEAQENLPRSPRNLGDKSKVKINIKEEDKSKVDSGLLNDAQNPVEDSLISLNDFSIDHEKLNPKPKKDGFGMQTEPVECAKVDKRTPVASFANNYEEFDW